MTESHDLLQISNVVKTFEIKHQGKLRALDGVSFSMAQGECVGIIGESGCGKSTLARIIACMDQADGGEVLFEGIAAQKRSLRAYRRQVQMVFQSPVSTFSPRMKIGRFLMEPWLQYEKMNRKEAKKMAIYGLERVHLDESYFDKYPHELSGGELQRIAIARAAALHPKLLICDEATSALDVSIQKNMIDFLGEHKKGSGCGILFISHDLALAEDFCDRILVMYLGQIVEVLPGKKLSIHARHPYTKALLASVFSVHDSQDTPIQVLKGEPPSPVNRTEGCVFCSRCPYASEKCKTEKPELQRVRGGHQVACHLMDK